MAIRKILAVRNDRFGEFLLTIPAFCALKRAHPGAHLTLAVSEYVRPLAGCIPWVDEVITLENRRYTIFEMVSLGRMLHKRKFDLCVIFNPSKYVNFISVIAGIPERAGYDHKCPFLLTRKVPDTKYRGDKHEIDYNLELAGAYRQECDKTISLSIKNDIINGLKEPRLSGCGAPLVAVHPWTSDQVKQWPLERFALLIQKIIKELDAQVVVVGLPEKGATLALAAHDRIIDLAAKTSLVQLAGVLQKCALLVSGDSGPVHMASCVGLPVLALFRNDMQGKNATRWGPHSPTSQVIAKNSLQEISVDEVFAKVAQMLAQDKAHA